MEHDEEMKYFQRIEAARLDPQLTFNLQVAVAATSFIESCTAQGKDPYTTLEGSTDPQLASIMLLMRGAVQQVLSHCRNTEVVPRTSLELLLNEAGV